MDNSTGPANGPTGKRVEIRIEGPPDSGIMRVRFLTDVDGTVGHWVHKKFRPCQGDAKECEWHKKVPLSWLGFAGAEWLSNGPPSAWVPCVVDVTERLYRTLGGEALRGTVWNLFKKSCGSMKKECFGEQVGDCDPRLLRRDVNVQSVVERVYRVRPMLWGQEPLWEGATMLTVTPLDVAAPVIEKADPDAGFQYVRPRKGMTFDEVARDLEAQRDAWRKAQAEKGGK